jgi:glucose/mannose-6-phosphate isomerase
MTIEELVAKYDKENQFQIISNSHLQILTTWQTPFDAAGIDVSRIQNIVVSGLGGSAIGGDLISDFTNGELSIPFFVNRNYGLPKFVDENSLVIASSYSGNTEETLSAAEEAVKRGSQIVAVTTGGKLEEFAKEKNIPLFIMKGGLQPRYALYSNFFALLKVLQKLALIDDQNKIVDSIAKLIENKGNEYRVDKSLPYKLAVVLAGTIPVIYGVSGVTSTLAVRLKGEFNENSKLHAFCNFLPEMNHNEIIGWETFDEAQLRAKAIFFKDKSYHPQISKRIEISKGLIQNAGAEIIELESNEKELKVRLFDLVFLGDWISYYLALIRKQDPTEIDNIIFLKENLQ